MDTYIPVRASIEKFGTTAIARAMGVPISTVHEWKQADALPGQSRLPKNPWLLVYEQRAKAFRKAVRELEAKAERIRASVA